MRWELVDDKAQTIAWADMEVEQRKALKQGVNDALGEVSLLPRQSFFRALGQKLQRAGLRPNGLNQAGWRQLVQSAYDSYIRDMQQVKNVAAAADLDVDAGEALATIEAEEVAEMEATARDEARAEGQKYADGLEDSIVLRRLPEDEAERIREQAEQVEEPVDVDALLLSRARQFVASEKEVEEYVKRLEKAQSEREKSLARLDADAQAQRQEAAEVAVQERKRVAAVQAAESKLPPCTVITDADIEEALERFPGEADGIDAGNTEE